MIFRPDSAKGNNETWLFNRIIQEYRTNNRLMSTDEVCQETYCRSIGPYLHKKIQTKLSNNKLVADELQILNKCVNNPSGTLPGYQRYSLI